MGEGDVVTLWSQGKLDWAQRFTIPDHDDGRREVTSGVCHAERGRAWQPSGLASIELASRIRASPSTPVAFCNARLSGDR